MFKGGAVFAKDPGNTVMRCLYSGQYAEAQGLAMEFKLIESAQSRWRAVNTPHLVALVSAGAQFERGSLWGPPSVSS